MASESITISPDVADELRKLAAQFTMQTGKRRTYSDLIMEGIKQTRRNFNMVDPAEESRSEEAH